jgi:hypothetical protein
MFRGLYSKLELSELSEVSVDFLERNALVAKTRNFYLLCIIENWFL